MSRAVLADKLALRGAANPEAAWNLRRWPCGLGEGANRLFVACDGHWRGYFRLAPDALFNPDDSAVPFAILFDTRSWTPIPPTSAKRFRGFTYAVPTLATAVTAEPSPQTPAARRRSPQTPALVTGRDARHGGLIIRHQSCKNMDRGPPTVTAPTLDHRH